MSRRKKIVELGAGWGDATEDLARRSSAEIVAIDSNQAAVAELALRFENENRVQTVLANAEDLPREASSSDLFFTQCGLLWMDVEAVVGEAKRNLAPGGAFVALEPDFGGLMVEPESPLASVWQTVLREKGADPLVGRKLPRRFEAQGFRVEVRFFDRLEPFQELSLQFLREMSPKAEEEVKLHQPESLLVHLPFWLVYAELG